VSGRQAPPQIVAELLTSAARSGLKLRLRVTGLSMFPAVRPGDVLTIDPVSIQTIRVGEIVLWARGYTLCAHRVVGFDNSRPITQGDALAAPDGPVAPSEVIGRVAGLERKGRVLPSPLLPSRWQRAVSHLLRVSPFFYRALWFLLVRRHRTRWV